MYDINFVRHGWMEKGKMLSVRISGALWREIEEKAGLAKMSVSKYVRKLLEGAMYDNEGVYDRDVGRDVIQEEKVDPVEDAKRVAGDVEREKDEEVPWNRRSGSISKGDQVKKKKVKKSNVPF